MSTRRTFIQKGITAGAAMTVAGLAPRRIFGDGTGFDRIAYRQLGSTGYKVSEIAFGCMNSRDEDLFRAGIDVGINYFDTANFYMNGVNEQVVGRALKGNRDKVFLATKIGLRKDIDAARRELDESLSRLQVDHVDLLQFHKLDFAEEVRNEDFIRLFDDARTAGKTRFVGITTHSNQTEVINAAVDGGFWEAVLTGYNYYSPPELTAAIKRAREAGMATIGMKNLITTERPRTPFPDIREEGTQDTITNQQALLKWVLDNRYFDAIVPGMTTFEQLADDVAIMGMKLSFEDREVIRRYGDAAGKTYCRGVAGCTECTDQCPKGVPVCEINRCLNYDEGYGDPELARASYHALPDGRNLAPCGDCDECTVKCVNGLDLAGNISRARSLFA